MPTANPTRQSFMPIAREGSPLRSPRDADDARQAWKRHAAARDNAIALHASVQKIATDIGRMRRRILGGPGGVAPSRWQEPFKELDPSVAVEKGTWVYVSDANPLHGVGMHDINTDQFKRARTGIWEAAQDVPAAVDGSYHVPGAVSGVGWGSGPPMYGHLDGGDVFWILIRGDDESSTTKFILKTVGMYSLTCWEAKPNPAYARDDWFVWTKEGWLPYSDVGSENKIDVTVAKNVDIVPISTETIGSDTINYTDYNDTFDERTATMGAIVHTEVIVPYYIPNYSVIVASQQNYLLDVLGDDTTVFYQELSSRAWAKKATPPS